MTMITKTVSGSGEQLKAVDNAKKASKKPQGGIQRTSFKGSNDPRKAKDVGPNETLMKADGYVNQGPVSSDLSDAAAMKNTSGGPKTGGAMVGQVTVAKEDVTKAFGNK